MEAGPEEMERMIRDGVISDGYTVGALELWKLKTVHKEK